MEKFTKLPYLGKYREREKGTRQHVGSSKNISCVKKIRLEIGKKKKNQAIFASRSSDEGAKNASRKEEKGEVCQWGSPPAVVGCNPETMG